MNAETDTEAAPPVARMRGYLQRIATGPEMSKPLSRAAARDAMRLILAREVGAVQAGIFLIAMRMKRETDAENLGALEALLEGVAGCAVDCDTLLDIADPFNGMARGVPAAPFLAPALAACGLNAYAHGLRAVGPKYGVTHHMVLAAAGIPVALPPAEVAARIANPRIGWGYVDQANYHPALHRLVDLRAQMVKRACITTIEVALGPLRAKRATHLLTGYVHKAYPPVYLQLARAAGYAGALIVRGVEGGCIPSLSQASRFFACGGGGDNGDGTGDRDHAGDGTGDGDGAGAGVGDGAGASDGAGAGESAPPAPSPTPISPQQIGIAQSARAIPIPAELAVETPVYPGSEQDGIAAPVDCQRVAEYAAELGERALAGDTGKTTGDDATTVATGQMRDSVIYGGALCLLHCGRAATLPDAAAQIRRALDSGEARRRFEAARE
ncbi:MAG: anthranilate phosphoribosyltransferase [Gammaproteobacteria bacterium]|nr:anthranilate phosphoribosyltransferase [Gammaproteobacteria bacterium]